MKPTSLVSEKIKIEIGEPWEFQDEVGRADFTGEIKQVFISHRAFESGENVREVLLVKLDEPFGYKNLKCEYLLAYPRHVGIGLCKLSEKSISFGFTRIPTDQGESDNPFDDCQWRGNKEFFLIGSIELKTNTSNKSLERDA